MLGICVSLAARRLPLSKAQLLAGSIAVYAALTAVLQVATRTTDSGAGTAVATSTTWTAVMAACWTLAIGAVVARFCPGAAQSSQHVARNARQRVVRSVALAAVMAVTGALVSTGSAAAAPRPEAEPQPWRAADVGVAVTALKKEADRKLIQANNVRTGTPSMLGNLKSPMNGHDVKSWLHAHSKVFVVADTPGMLSKATDRAAIPDSTGARHLWYEQSIDGVPVYGAQVGDSGTGQVFGRLDNVVASGHSLAVNGNKGNTLGFLLSSAYGPAGGTGTVRYSDGSTQQFTLSGLDWFGGTGDKAITPAYQNRQGNQRYQGAGYVFYAGVSLQTGKRPVSVRPPDVSSAPAPDMPTLHVIAMTRG